MPQKKPMTVTELAHMGGEALLKKYGKRKLRQWGKLGGRPRKKVRGQRGKER